MLFASILVFLTLTQPSIILARSLKPDNEEEIYEISIPHSLIRKERAIGIEPLITFNTDTILNILILFIMAAPYAPKLPMSVYRFLLNPLGLNAAFDLKGGIVLNGKQLEFPLSTGVRLGALGLTAGLGAGVRPSAGIRGVKMSAGVVAGFGSKIATDGIVANGDTRSIQRK